MRKQASVMAIALVATMGLVASAQEKGQSGNDKDQGSAQRRTARGTVAAVTVLGETMVNYETGQAAVAQANYLTVVESPRNGKAGHDGQEASDKSDQQAAKDKEESSSKKGDAKQGDAKQGDAMKQRARVYVLAITPKTEVCEGKDGESKESCDLARLELGDRVEVEFTRWGMPTQGSGGERKKAEDDRSKSGDGKHGRNRLIRGEATSIRILPGDSAESHSSDSAEKESSGQKKN